MAKHRVDHKKISGNHTTLIAAAVPIIKSIIQLASVRRVSPGFIRGGLRNLQKFPARIKIIPGQGYIKLLVRAQTAVQEIYIYCNDGATIVELLRRQAVATGYGVAVSDQSTSETEIQPPTALPQGKSS